MKNTIVVGASSGIGLELARIPAANGYGAGLVARRRVAGETHVSGEQ
jgi:short-subunit dehydrogenase